MADRDYSKLLGRMREMGYTQEKLAQTIGIGVTSLSLKLKGHRQFKQAEMLAIASALDFNEAEIADYFFKQRLSISEV